MAVNTTQKKVLIIDDEQDIVDLISEVLARDQYKPIVATVWTEAIDAITSAEPDLMLLDLKMPTIDGSAILEFIRKEGIDLPVIVVSGFVTDDAEKTLSGLGVAAFVRKPFKVGQLKAEIERVLGGPGAPEAAETAEAGSPSADKDVLNAFEKLKGTPRPVDRASDEDGMGREGPGPQPHEADVLQAFRKLDTPPARRGPAPNPNPSAEDVKAAFRRQQAAEKTGRADAAAGLPQPAAEAPREAAVPPADTAGRQAAALPEAEVPQESSEHRYKRTHHRGRRHSRSTSRRNLVYMGLITLVCVVIASFLAIMQWYAAEVDVKQIKKGVTKSVQDQMKEELLKELKDQKK